ncbi:hypothetical protein FN846DRAFT_153485 [Sphaerosporella brunnea]|uniref:Secreted protein n=1 Tax=Sphaerosporella brunnea TaxID=1250544 RepID=A0A5J5F8H9_9PEZI|nr:hypothetical protein FN846DRAFT_153485 [Sphaerosporella brunnea]
MLLLQLLLLLLSTTAVHTAILFMCGCQSIWVSRVRLNESPKAERALYSPRHSLGQELSLGSKHSKEGCICF